MSIRIDFPSVEKQELEKPKDRSVVGIQRIEQSHNCDDIIVPQPLSTIWLEGFRLIPIYMPNQLEKARRNGRFFIDPRDPIDFRYYTLSIIIKEEERRWMICSAKKKERERFKK